MIILWDNFKWSKTTINDLSRAAPGHNRSGPPPQQIPLAVVFFLDDVCQRIGRKNCNGRYISQRHGDAENGGGKLAGQRATKTLKIRFRGQNRGLRPYSRIIVSINN